MRRVEGYWIMTFVPAEGAVDGDLIIKQLTAGDGGPVLVADFQAFSSAPRLGQLIGAKAQGRPVYQVDPLDFMSLDRSYVPLTDMADVIAGQFPRSGPADGRAVILGYCSAAGLALHVATLLARSREVCALLLQPSWPGDQVVKRTFASLIANLGSADRPCPDLDGDPGDRMAAIEQILRTEMEALAASRGLGGSMDVFLELLLTYRSWLAFLLACRNDSPLAWADGTAAVTVLSNTQGVTVPGLAPGSFGVTPLPVTDSDNPVTDEVVDIVAAQIMNR